MLTWLFRRQGHQIIKPAWRWFATNNTIEEKKYQKNSLDPTQLHVACAHYLPKEWTEEEIKKRLDPTGSFLSRVQIIRNRLGDHSGKVIMHFPRYMAMTTFISKYHEQFVKTGEGDGVQMIVVKPFLLRPTSVDSYQLKHGVKLSGIDFSLGQKEVHKLARDFGEVVNVKIPMGPDGRNLGFAVVHFKDANAGKEFLAFMDKRVFLGKYIRASPNTPRLPPQKSNNKYYQQKPLLLMRSNSRLVKEYLAKKSVPMD